MTTPVHPHDLLRIDPGRVTEMLTPVDPGQWQMIDGCLERAPFVVVRRACAGAGLIPVGIRGEERSQRFAAWLDPNGICEVIRPESLRRRDKSRELPVFAALRALDHRWLPSLPSWGPAGSVGLRTSVWCADREPRKRSRRHCPSTPAAASFASASSCRALRRPDVCGRRSGRDAQRCICTAGVPEAATQNTVANLPGADACARSLAAYQER